MNKDKDKLFYTRHLQKKLYFRNNRFINSLFYLEKYLFDNFNINEEVPISYIKQKWIYDCIKKNDFSNEFSKDFESLGKSKSKEKVLLLINAFSKIPNISNTNNFLNFFQKFNKIFNNIIDLESNSNFKTSIFFQLTFLIYSKQYTVHDLFKKKNNYNRDSIDVFELVFIEFFLKNYNYKISKVSYLYRLLIKFLKK